MVATTNCGHVVPVFGCQSCFLTDRERSRATAFSNWLKTYKPPVCESCGRVMLVDAEWYVEAGVLKALVVCATTDSEGEIICGTEIQAVIG